MSWAKLDDQLHSNEKWLDLSLAARGLWSTCLSWVADKETDGAVSRSVVRLHGGAQWEELSNELVATGMWDVTEAGWQFHDYLDYNPSKAELEEERRKAAERKAAWKAKRASTNGDGTDGTPTSGTATERRSTSVPNGDGTLHPDPDPDPGSTKVLQPPISPTRQKQGAPAVVSSRANSALIVAEADPFANQTQEDIAILNRLKLNPDWEVEARKRSEGKQNPQAYFNACILNWEKGEWSPPSEKRMTPPRDELAYTRTPEFQAESARREAEGNARVRKALCEQAFRKEHNLPPVIPPGEPSIVYDPITNTCSFGPPEPVRSWHKVPLATVTAQEVETPAP